MQNIFDLCLEHILEFEGGFVDHPNDPGGATNLGITLRTLTSWRDGPVTVEDLQALTREEAAEIYRNRYWNLVKASELPPSVALVVFDMAVNMGPRLSARMLQLACRHAGQSIVPDGLIGPATLAAVRKCESGPLIREMAARRITYYASRRHAEDFMLGWSRRVLAVTEAAQRMPAGWG